jgi:hypothetical protein
MRLGMDMCAYMITPQAQHRGVREFRDSQLKKKTGMLDVMAVAAPSAVFTNLERLEHLIIAEPVEQVAQHVAEQTAAMAKERTIIHTGEGVIESVLEYRPEMMLVSLDIGSPDVEEIAKAVKAEHPGLYLVGVYRELSVQSIKKLKAANFDDLLPIPIDMLDLYRLASARFKRAFRRHVRFPVEIEVLRPDGVVLGVTRDLSEGGLRMGFTQPMRLEQSLMLYLRVVGREPIRIRGVVIDVDTEVKEARINFEGSRGQAALGLTQYLRDLTTSMANEETVR